MLRGREGLVWAATPAGVGRFEDLGRLYTLGRPSEGGPADGLAQTLDGDVYELRSSSEGFGGLAQQVVRIAGSGASVLATLAGSAPDTMATGPDGSLYVAIDDEGAFGCVNGLLEGVRCGPKIVRVAPDGSAHVLPIPYRVNELGPIVAGADGNVWFAMQGVAPALASLFPTEIVRLTPRGQFTAWTVNAAAEHVGGLAAGPTGIWFTLGSHTVGRITYEGQVESFSAGIPSGAEPDGITVGPEGAMWFTELRANAIARIKSDGRITQYPWGPLRVVSPLEGEPDGADAIIAPGDGTLLAFVPVGDEFVRFSPSGRCIVPQLTGLALVPALRTLRVAGCRSTIGSGHRAGVVASQGAQAGELLAPGRPVHLRTILARAAARRCLLAPSEREILADSRAILAGEVTTERGVRYVLCRPGHAGPSQAQIPAWDDGEGYGGETGLFSLAGNFLAWQAEYNTKYLTHFASVEALDVANGRPVGASGNLGEQGGGVTGDAVDVAVDGRGDLAWHLRLSYPPAAASPCRADAKGIACPLLSEDRASDKIQALVAGHVVTLAEGTAEAFGKLMFSPAGTLHWAQQGTAKSYTFAPNADG